MQMPEANEWPVIYSYTRAQAIEDGVLVDVTERAREAGLRYPVAVTQAVWADIITPDERARAFGQSESGRLWDTLYMLRHAAVGVESSEIRYEVYYVMKARQQRRLTLKAVCGPGDGGEPVLTIMLPEED